MTTVTFYHSAVCPRCRLAALALRSVLEDYPHIRVERVEYLTNARAARVAGVRSIPALRAGDRKLDGFLLSRRRIRNFFDSLEMSERSSAASG
jgi:hypothetical protein